MKSNTVESVLKLYNILSCGKADEPKYKETLFYKSVTNDTGALTSILNGESPEKVMKINTPAPTSGKPVTGKSNKFGFFEGNKKVYELFGHALRRIIETYGSETTFSEEDMFIHDDEEIKEKDYTTITTFFNMKAGTKYTKDHFTQEVSARDIYLHIYAEKFKPFTEMIKESLKLKVVEKELNEANEQLKSNKSSSKSMQTIISSTKPAIERKYQAYIGVINNRQNEMKQNQENYLTKLDELRKKYEQECRRALQMKTDKDKQIKSKYDELIKISSNDLNQCITGLINECDIYKK